MKPAHKHSVTCHRATRHRTESRGLRNWLSAPCQLPGKSTCDSNHCNDGLSAQCQPSGKSTCDSNNCDYWVPGPPSVAGPLTKERGPAEGERAGSNAGTTGRGVLLSREARGSTRARGLPGCHLSPLVSQRKSERATKSGSAWGRLGAGSLTRAMIGSLPPVQPCRARETPRRRGWVGGQDGVGRGPRREAGRKP